MKLRQAKKFNYLDKSHLNLLLSWIPSVPLQNKRLNIRKSAKVGEDIGNPCPLVCHRFPTAYKYIIYNIYNIYNSFNFDKVYIHSVH